MFDVGLSELFFLAVIAVIVLGPDKLPDAIRYILKLKLKFSSLKQSLNQTLQKELELNQLKDELNSEIDQIKNLEKKMQSYFSKLDHQILKSDLKYFYPVEHFEIKIPYQAVFILNHLIQWSCFKMK